MIKKKILFFILICVILLSYSISWSEDPFTDNAKAKIHHIKINESAIKQYGLLEFSIELSAAYNNPFDPSQIELTGYFITPSKKEIIIPGFFYQNFKRKLEHNREYLDELGNPSWKIRFTPIEIGTYKYYIKLKNKGKTVKSKVKTFRVIESNNPGFIRVAKDSIYYMKFDSGKPYFAVGESITWTSRKKQTYGYDYYFSKLAENSCNYSRIWLVEWNLALEWMDSNRTKGKTYGLGKYSLDNSWRLDYIIELAREKEIYILLTLDTYGSIMDEKGYWGEQRWINNPYNAENGGPCEKPEDFWTNEEAKKLYKRRLRYILSRWGYSPNILAFELWNEVNAPREWVEEMAHFIKENDPYGHFVTTSIGYPFNEKHTYDTSQIWNLKEIDYTQTHLYGERGNIADVAKAIRDRCIFMTDKYKKPHIIAEFGLDCMADDRKYDKEGKGTHLHNALWASIMSRSFGTAMTHWKEYIDKKDLYYQFKAIFNFVKDINWLNGKWGIAKIGNLKLDSAKKTYSDLVVACEGDWGEEDGEDITITREGKVKGKINQFIHGMTKEDDLRFIPVFHVDYPDDGKFILDIDSVAQGADLRVYLDGNQIWQHTFGAGPDKGEWKSCKLHKKYNIYIAKYDKKYEIDIPKGKHDIRFKNIGKDWIRLKTITLTNYRDESIPFIRVLGLSRENEAVLWIQNKESIWYNAYRKIEIKPVNNISFNLLGLSDGNYEIEWWDTLEGIIIDKEKGVCKNNILPIKISKILTDIACKINRID